LAQLTTPKIEENVLRSEKSPSGRNRPPSGSRPAENHPRWAALNPLGTSGSDFKEEVILDRNMREEGVEDKDVGGKNLPNVPDPEISLPDDLLPNS
jgi:hypothetical protein